MTTQKTTELKQMFEEVYTVTVTVAPFQRISDEQAYDISFNSFDEAIKSIEILENENAVYF